MNRSLRCCLLQLIRALVAPKATDEASMAAAKANGSAFMDAGGIAICVDFLAVVHESTERTGHVPLNTNLIENISHEEKMFEWCYYPDGIKIEGLFYIYFLN